MIHSTNKSRSHTHKPAENPPQGHASQRLSTSNSTLKPDSLSVGDSFEDQQALRVFQMPADVLEQIPAYQKLSISLAPGVRSDKVCLHYMEPSMTVMRATRHFNRFAGFEQNKDLEIIERDRFQLFKKNLKTLFGVELEELPKTVESYQALFMNRRTFKKKIKSAG